MPPHGTEVNNNWQLNMVRKEASTIKGTSTSTRDGITRRGRYQHDIKLKTMNKKVACTKQKSSKLKESREKATIRAMNRRKKLKQEKQDQIHALLKAQIQNEQLKQENEELKKRYQQILLLKGSSAATPNKSVTAAVGTSINPPSDMDLMLLAAAAKKRRLQQQNSISLLMMNDLGLNAGLNQGMSSVPLPVYSSLVLQTMQQPRHSLSLRDAQTLGHHYASTNQGSRAKVLPPVVSHNFQDYLTLAALGKL